MNDNVFMNIVLIINFVIIILLQDVNYVDKVLYAWFTELRTTFFFKLKNIRVQTNFLGTHIDVFVLHKGNPSLKLILVYFM